jgi:hypothetical protein
MIVIGIVNAFLSATRDLELIRLEEEWNSIRKASNGLGTRNCSSVILARRS